MLSLPISIEQQLYELGFSTTELLIIRRLMEDANHTIRTLAKKTGKSTGVLSQAMKKLMDRGLVQHDMQNATQAYTLASATNICRYIAEIHTMKKDELERKEENFRRFIEQLTEKKPQEELLHFNARTIERALQIMLKDTQEICIYTPHLLCPESSSLRKIFDAFHRERMRRNIFLRVIAPLTQENIKEAMKDGLSSRKSLLLDAERYPISFERILTPNSLLCIDLKQGDARLIQFPSLAAHEYQYFVKLWTKKHSDEVTMRSENIAAQIPINTLSKPYLQKIFLKCTIVLSLSIVIAAGFFTNVGAAL